MAQLLNYRNALLHNAAQRVVGSAVVITSGAATSLSVPKGSNTTVPGTITLTASATKFVVPVYAWYYKKYEDTTFTLIPGQILPTLDIVGDLAFLTANLATSAVQYKVIVTETGAAYQGTSDYTVTLPILRDGTDGTLGFLTNDSVIVPANAIGEVDYDTYASLDSTLVIYRGSADDSANWSVTISAYTPGLTASLIDGKTISITNITPEFNIGYVEVIATRQNYASIVKRFRVAKVATGVSPTVYSIEPSVYAIAKNPDGSYNPVAVTFSSYSVVGNIKSAFPGRISIYHNDSVSPAYYSQEAEAVKVYTIPAGITTLRVEFHTLSPEPILIDGYELLMDGLPIILGEPSVLLDSQTIPVAEAGSSSVNVTVTNSTFVIPANANNDILSYANSGTNITVREGLNSLVYRTSLIGQVSSFTIGTATLSTGAGIFVGSVSAGSNGSTVATILQHSSMMQSLDSIIITYPVTYVRANGAQATEYVTQSITKTATGYRGSRNLYSTNVEYTSVYDYDGVGMLAPGPVSYAKKADDLVYAATLNSSPRTPIEGDTLTFSNNDNYVYTITYKAATDSWVPPGTIIDGSLLVTGSITADKLDTRNIIVRGASGTPIIQPGSPINWEELGTPSSNLSGLGYIGALDATRNVFRGAWSTSTAYVVGDSVTDKGSTWAAVSAHTSVNGTNNPPTLPTISNSYWTLVAAKGDNGVNGSRTAVLEMYKWSVNAPNTFPSGNSTYTWNTGQFTAPATVNGWSITPPASVEGSSLWVCRTLFADTLTTPTSTVAWNAELAIQAGANGANGMRTAVLELYKWSATTPATFPTGTSTYTWATGQFTTPATTNGWSLMPGASVAGHTLWGCSAVYTDTFTTSTATVTWPSAAPVAYAIGAAGSNGAPGEGAISVVLSNEAHVFPAANDGTVSSTVGSGTEIRVYQGATLLAYDGVGTASSTWKVVATPTNIALVGSITDQGDYASVASHTSVSAGVDTSSVSYYITGKNAAGNPFAVTKLQTFAKAKIGPTGVNGTRTAILEMYQWAVDAPTSFPSGSSTYTWSSGQFTTPATTNSWTLVPAASVPGNGLWVCRTLYADTQTSATTSITWNAVVALPAGATGETGLAGTNGRRTAILELYRWAPTSPLTYPTGSSTYTWDTGQFSAPANLNGWSLTPGAAVPGDVLWGCRAVLSDTDVTATSSVTWPTVSPVSYVVGAAGADSTAYWLVSSTPAIQKSLVGVYTPDVVTYTIMSSKGAAVPAPYAGRFIIDTSTDGVSYTDPYTSGTNEASKAYTVPPGIKTIRVRAFLQGSTSTLVDLLICTIISDGAQGTQGLKGDTGINGDTLYTWVKYADTPTTGMSDFPASKAYLGVAYNKLSAIESNTYADYAWSLIKGDQGITGGTGPNGATLYTWIKYADSITGTGLSDTATGKTYIGIAVNKASATESTVAADYTWALIKGNDGQPGAGALTAILSNEAHVFSAASDGTVQTYAGSGTEIRVYEGATALTYDGVGTTNGTWKVTSAVSGIAIGSLTPSGNYLVVGTHNGMAAATSVATVTYTITGKSTNGVSFTTTKVQTFSKSKTGVDGASGSVVDVTSNRAAVFTSTDGVLDVVQGDIVFTASVTGVPSPTYVWTFNGFEVAPTNSGSSSQTITKAQFGIAKYATVTCTINGSYSDKTTIVRLEKSTAAAGATVGAPAGTTVGGVPAETVASDAAGALKKAGDSIAGTILFDTNGKILAGSDTTGVIITGNGILGMKDGVPTFGLSTSGDAVISGDITGSTGTFFGKITAGAIDLTKLSGSTERFGRNGISNPTQYYTLQEEGKTIVITLAGAGGGGESGQQGAMGFRGGSGGTSVYKLTNVPVGTVFSINVGIGGEPGVYMGLTGPRIKGKDGQHTTITYVTTYMEDIFDPVTGEYITSNEVTGPITLSANPGKGGDSYYNTPSMVTYLDGEGKGQGKRGGGGAGGAGTYANSYAGYPGYVRIEVYDPNGVVSRPEWVQLMDSMRIRLGGAWPS